MPTALARLNAGIAVIKRTQQNPELVRICTAREVKNVVDPLGKAL
jgi:hypothetical protein